MKNTPISCALKRFPIKHNAKPKLTSCISNLTVQTLIMQASASWRDMAGALVKPARQGNRYSAPVKPDAINMLHRTTTTTKEEPLLLSILAWIGPDQILARSNRHPFRAGHLSWIAPVRISASIPILVTTILQASLRLSPAWWRL
jgi:hypothetical protein